MENKIEIGLTQFIDFSSKLGASRVNFLRKVKYQDSYHPSFDYWKQLRDGIKNYHQNKLGLPYLSDIAESADVKKKNNYSTALRQYMKFIKGKNIQWFDAGKSHWIYDVLFVRSSPDLGLIINNEQHLLKLYFKGKSEKITKYNIAVSLTLMKESKNSLGLTEITTSVLNIDKAKLHQFTKKTSDDLRIALEADAANLIHIWNNI